MVPQTRCLQGDQRARTGSSSTSLQHHGDLFAYLMKDKSVPVLNRLSQRLLLLILIFSIQPPTSFAHPQQDQAISQDSLDQLGQIVQQYVKNGLTIGAELQVIQDEKVLYHKSFGLSDRDSETAWKNDTICNIRSMTKPITSAAAQILIDRGLLELDEPVSAYLASFDNEKSKTITVRQVLSHRSGLPLTNLTISPYQFKSLEDQVANIGKKGPQFEPGSKFWYSDIGTDVVGRLIETVSGKPLNEFVKSELLVPLAMKNTFYGIDNSDKRLAVVASPYMKGRKGKWTQFWKPGGRPLYPFAWGSQTLYSTTSDYALFLKMLVDEGRVGNRQLLSKAAVARMLAPVSRTKGMGSDTNVPTGFHNVESWYGQMMMTYRPSGHKERPPAAISHSGSDGTIAWSWPDRKLTILYFTQSRGGFTPIRIEESIDGLILHPGRSLVEDIPANLQPFVGTFVANYDSFDNERFTVRVRDSKLILDVPSQLAFELLEPNADGLWPFAIAPEQIRVSFDRDDNDKVIALNLHKGGNTFNVPKLGTAAAKLQLANKASDAKTESKSGKESLQETWVGALEMGGLRPVMQFRIVELQSGKTKAYFDSVTEGRTGFDATWSIEGNVLKFDVAKIRLTYRGKLNNRQDSATGHWSQGGRKLPLTLKKQSAETSENAGDKK